MDGDIVPRFHAQPPPSFPRTPLDDLPDMIRLMVRHCTRSSAYWQGRWQSRDGLVKPRLAFRSTGASRVVCDSRSRRGVEHRPPEGTLRVLEEMSCAVTVRRLARRLGQMSEAELRKHHRVLHKRLQRGRPLDQSRRRAALVNETSDEADRRGWCPRAGACAVSPMCGGPRAAVPASPGRGSDGRQSTGGGGSCHPPGQRAVRMRCSMSRRSTRDVAQSD